MKFKHVQTILILMFVLATTSCTQNRHYLVNQIEDRSREFHIIMNINRIKLEDDDPSAYIYILDHDHDLTVLCRADANCLRQYQTPTMVMITDKQKYTIPHYSEIIKCGEELFFKGLLSKPSYPYGGLLCKSAFYITSNLLGFERTFGGFFTLGLLTVSAGSLHEKTFDGTVLASTINNEKLDYLNEYLVKNNILITGVTHIVYLDPYELEDDLDDAFERIVNANEDINGLVFINRQTKNILAAISLKSHSEVNIMESVNKQMEAVLYSISTPQTMDQIGQTMEKSIPREIKAPSLPPVPTLVKSEYETKAAFEKRVEQAVYDRQEKIRALQAKYDQDVKTRNAYIDLLSQSLSEYGTYQNDQSRQLVNKLLQNRARLARLLFAFNAGKTSLSNMLFDAETGQLYLTYETSRYGIYHRMAAKMPPESARNIKEKKAYRVQPVYETEQDAIRLTGIGITDTVENDDFHAFYTNVNYQPDKIRVTIKNPSEYIGGASSRTLSQYHQVPDKLTSQDTREVWYIDLVKRINAKVPDWFETPEDTNKTLAYGVGNSHDEAMANARSELAYIINTQISSKLDIVKQGNTLRSFTDVQHAIHAQTDVELNSGDYSVYKQEESDGRYYVALCYRCR